MNRTSRRRQETVNRVLAHLRRGIPAGELDKEDWDSLRVATRIVFETEDLRVLLCSPKPTDVAFAITYWTESVESGIEFMSWTKCLATIVRGTKYPKERCGGSLDELWEHHRVLAARLRVARLRPGTQLSLLAELGGVELSLLGYLWWRKPTGE